MLKFGQISEIDFKKGMARVYFDEDEMVSGWLQISVLRSGKDQITFPFDINESVYCIMDENCEFGVVAGAVYTNKVKPNECAAGKLRIEFADKTTIEYDRNSHILKLEIKGKTIINCDEKTEVTAPEVTITATETKITGKLSVTGAATINGVVSVGGLSGISGAPVAAGDTVINAKEIIASDDIKVGTISLKTHKHTSAASGSPTSPPI